MAEPGGPLAQALALLSLSEDGSHTVAEVVKAYRKRVVSHASGKGGGKMEEYTQAFVDIISHLQQDALADSGSVSIVQKCKECIPGEVKVKNSLIILKTDQPGRIWRKVIKQKHPGAVSMKPKNEGPESSGSKFSTTWRPSGDYIHLKITFLVQNSAVQVAGSSFLLWAIENYQEFCNMAEKIAEKEKDVDAGLDESEKINKIIKGLKDMREDIDQIASKLGHLETEQGTEHEQTVTVHEKIDEISVKIQEIRQVTGARCLADGQSAAFIINTMNREEREMKEEEEDSIIADKARSDPIGDEEVEPCQKPNTFKQTLPPPNVLKKNKLNHGSPRRKITRSQIEQINRMETVEDDSGFKSEDYLVKGMEFGDNEDTEESIEDISFNEM